MAQSGEQIGNPASGFGLRFIKTAADTGGELLEMEATYEPSSTKPVEHFHPRQREHFEILEGTMHARIGSEERELSAGDTLDIEAGVPHAMWNEGTEQARTLWQTRPALRTEDFFETILRLGSAGKAGGPSDRGDRERVPGRVPRHVPTPSRPDHRRRRPGADWPAAWPQGLNRTRVRRRHNRPIK